MGFYQTGLSLTHPRNDGMKLDVMLLNKDTGKTCKGMNPVRWGGVWVHVSLHLYQRRIVEYSPLQKLRVHFNRSLFEVDKGVKRFLRWIR